MKMTSDIVVIGGGIAGLAVATELALRHVGSITILEKKYFGCGNSTRNLGIVKAMQVNEKLTRLAVRCFEKIESLSDLLGFNFLLYCGGYAWVLYDEDEMVSMRDVCAMHKRLGIKSELLNAEDALRLLPIYRYGEPVRGALYSPMGGSLHHDALVWGYFQKSRALGVKILQSCEVTSIDTKAGRVCGVCTNQGEIETQVLVNAAGPFSSGVAKAAGISMPTVPLRREVVITMPIKPLIDCACISYRPSDFWVKQTMRGEIIFGAPNPRETPGINMRTSPYSLVGISSMVKRKTPILGGLKIIRSWAGAYDVSPDKYPMVGKSTEVDGFYQLNGWSGRGVLVAPFLSEMLADQIAFGKKDAVLDVVDPNRFIGKDVHVELSKDYYGQYKQK